MSDLASGRYADSEEEWLLDGSPFPPYRRTISRRDIASGSTGLALTQANLFVYAVPVQVGDIFNYVSFLAKTATATPTHSWIALYNGVATTSTLLAQSADATGGFAVGTNKLQLASTVANIGTIGTPQGGGSAAVVPNGPAVWGVALYNSGATGAVLDGAPGGQVAGAVAVTGQLPLIFGAALAATATAPATLAGLAAIVGTGTPYVLLSRQ
jgi:hypothetical protein